jgi:quercetin 2,3-dioxygenase
MNQQPKVKIFLADNRGCDANDWFRSYNTFNFGKYFDEHKYPFGDLYALNDNTVAGGYSVNLDIEEGSFVLLVPVVGTVLCKAGEGGISIINTGQLQISKVTGGTTIELLNCYENELINFIEILIKSGSTGSYNKNVLFTFDLDENKNQLIKITGSAAAEINSPVVSMGKFTGRHEAVYELQNKLNDLFFFVIQGVFEVQGRLLHARDGLGLWNEPGDIDLEALSNDAIVLIIEMTKA